MEGFRCLVAVVLLIALAACSDVKSVVGLEDEGGALTVSTETPTVPVGGSTTLRFQLTRRNGEPAKDGTEVNVTSVKLGQVESARLWTHNGGAVATIYRAGSRPGTEQVEAEAGGVKGRLSFPVEVPAPTPPPAPAASAGSGSGTPGSASAGSPNSAAIDLASVTWLDPNVSGWAETSRITRTSIGNPPICIEHTKAGQWPVKDGLEGNPWVLVNLDGRWYAATYEWLSPGQTCKNITADNIGPHIGRPPLSGWRPRSGELIGLMVSARARFRGDTVSERSNVVMVRWP